MNSLSGKSKSITIYIDYYWWEIFDANNLLRANEYYCSDTHLKGTEYNFEIPCPLLLTRYVIEYFAAALNNENTAEMISDVPSFIKLVEQLRQMSVYFNDAFNDIEFL